MAYAELREAKKTYGSVAALAGIDLEVGAGELVALLGPNGAGKTTAVRAMLGMTSLDQGETRLFGAHPRSRTSRRRIGVMLQSVQIPATLKVIEQIRLFSSYYPNPLAERAVVEAAGLEGLEQRLCGKLSGGQRQRVAFALAICGNPDLLFLDEPTTGLDVESRRAFWGSIRKFVARGGSALLTTHYLEEADALADRVAIINRGRIIAEGRPEQVKARAASTRVRCSTHLEPAAILTLPGVAQVRGDGARIEIFTSLAEATVRELLGRDPSLSGLEVAPSGLEQALLTLTEEDERVKAEAA